ncbi:MAG TPA: hypothetical protein VE981_08155 [Planctomycetota bacterium]|nr:hypothetical protein [Planctomycetota bacterium]
MVFARRVFRGAGIYGLLVVGPQYFLETRTGVDHPPPVTHPEFYYGFVGVTVAFQVVFLMIATDPARYRPMMLASVLEKATFAIAMPLLYLQQRIPGLVLGFSMIDLLLGVLFAVAYVRTSDASRSRP